MPLKMRIGPLGLSAATGGGGGGPVTEPPSTSPTPPGTPPCIPAIAGAMEPASGTVSTIFFGMIVGAVSCALMNDCLGTAVCACIGGGGAAGGGGASRTVLLSL